MENIPASLMPFVCSYFSSNVSLFLFHLYKPPIQTLTHHVLPVVSVLSCTKPLVKKNCEFVNSFLSCHMRYRRKRIVCGSYFSKQVSVPIHTIPELVSRSIYPVWPRLCEYLSLGSFLK